MKTILHIESSSNLHTSVSREIGAAALESLLRAHPGAKVVNRDLAKNPVPHLAPAFVEVMYTKPDAPELALSRELVDELKASDVIVLEAPMYNFNIPSVLKAWIDHVARAGLTFQYGANGIEGLLKGKKAILVLGRGGMYAQGPMKAMDYQETYLRAVLGFLGITDVETVLIEGVGMGPDKRAEALTKARARIATLTALKAA
ncbi:MAG: FMN-dependent NADH-azoreductase [Alphaproteobacteria bacterium]|nr:FMN-dependent NADH-azoreductase [Alphaproteobacteria bacterium]MDE2336736.1 FMN-dependent NADH-azoreductase [Alphaproteobacteria bacterium]